MCCLPLVAPACTHHCCICFPESPHCHQSSDCFQFALPGRAYRAAVVAVEVICVFLHALCISRWAVREHGHQTYPWCLGGNHHDHKHVHLCTVLSSPGHWNINWDDGVVGQSKVTIWPRVRQRHPGHTIVCVGIFSSALVSMWCEQWKNKDKAASQLHHFKIPQWPKPQTSPIALLKQKVRISHRARNKKRAVCAQPSHRWKGWMFLFYQFCTPGWWVCVPPNSPPPRLSSDGEGSDCLDSWLCPTYESHKYTHMFCWTLAKNPF